MCGQDVNAVECLVVDVVIVGGQDVKVCECSDCQSTLGIVKDSFLNSGQNNRDSTSAFIGSCVEFSSPDTEPPTDCAMTRNKSKKRYLVDACVNALRLSNVLEHHVTSVQQTLAEHNLQQLHITYLCCISQQTER
jgi:hypothetical protein